MLTRHNRPAGDLTNDEYMLGLIETRFGHPTEQELKDLIYFGPKDVDPKNEITMRWREEKKTQYSTLLNAFLKTAKARQFHKTRTLGTETEIDTVRVKYLMKASRRTDAGHKNKNNKTETENRILIDFKDDMDTEKDGDANQGVEKDVKKEFEVQKHDISKDGKTTERKENSIFGLTNYQLLSTNLLSTVISKPASGTTE